MPMELNLDEYDREYDTDEISVTSSAPTNQENGAEYEVEGIISEGQNPDTGETVYLIKWAGYPIHECTWEPPEHFASTTNILHYWKMRKLNEGDAFEEYASRNYDLYEEAVEKAEAAKARRKQKRTKKRRQFAQAQEKSRQMSSDDDESDDVPLLSRRRSQTSRKPSEEEDEGDSSKVPTVGAAVAQKASLEQSSSSEPSDHDDSSDATQDSMLEEISERQKRRNPRKTRGTSDVDPTSLFVQEYQKPNGPNTVSSAKEHPKEISSKSPPQLYSTKDLDQRPAPKTAASSTAASDAMKKKPNTARKVMPPKTLGPSASAPIAKTVRSNHQQATKVSRPINIVNQPKPKKQDWKSDKLYGTLKSQANGRKHFQAEGTPDPTVLDFVNGKPTGKAPPRLPIVRSQTSDNPFGRRESGLRRNVDDSSPPPPLSNRPLQPFEKGKIPMVCFDYRTNNSCIYGAQKCRFMHREESPSGREYKTSDPFGKIPPKYMDPPLTCWWWLRSPGGCRSSAEDCTYAHENKGLLAHVTGGMPEIIDRNELPPSALPKPMKYPITCWYWLKGLKGCAKPADQCSFAHWNTGTSRKDGKDMQIDPAEMPCQSSSRPACFFWNAGKCKNKHCRYPHEYTGVVARPPLGWDFKSDREQQYRYEDGVTSDFTCFLWTHGLCRLDENKCRFLHRWTSKIAKPPPDFVNPLSAQEQNASPSLGNAPLQHSMEVRNYHEPAHGYRETAGMDVDMPDADDSVLPKPLPPPPSVLHEQPLQHTDVPPPPPPPPLPSSSSHPPPPPSPSMSAPHGLPPQFEPENSAATLPTMQLKERIDACFGLDFEDMFASNIEDETDATLEKRAFLMLHPQYHMEELDVLTRWLLVHHVQVFNFWTNGAWDVFRMKMNNRGRGVVIAHPEFELYAEIPRFFEILRAKVRIWSVGHQAGKEFDPSIPSVFPPSTIKYRYDAIEIFPHGGIIYITDDVFLQRPQQALAIIKLFLAQIEACRRVDGPADLWKRVDDAFLPWRLGVRPELMDFLYNSCIKHETAIEARDPNHTSRAELYQLLSASPYIEQDTGEEALERRDSAVSADAAAALMRPDDYFPIISERRSVMQELYFAPLSTSQNLANTKMVEYFAGLVLELRQSYRHFFVVHTQPEGVTANDWKKKIGHLDEVISPERCIEEFERGSRGSRFDFFEWAFAAKG